MRKKKSFIFFFLLFVTLFLGGFSSSCKALELEEYQLSIDDIENLVSKLDIGNYFSGDFMYSWQNTFNLWMRVRQADAQFQWSNYTILFYRTSSNLIGWTVCNRQIGQSSTQPDFYIGNLNTTATSLTLQGFNDWTRNNNNEITGITSKSFYVYDILTSSPNTVRTQTISSSLSISNPANTITIERNSLGEYNTYIPRFIVWFPSYEPSASYGQRIAGRNTTQAIGYNYFWLTNVFHSSGDLPSPLPTTTPSGGGGGGSTDLTQTNSLIGQVKTAIENQNEEYWGSSDAFSGDEQISQISSSASDLISSASGELAENSIFSSLQEFEEGFFDLLANRDTQSMDFRIFWPVISMSGEVLIPSGEVNFSKLCRDNSTLANVQSTIRTIFNFSFGLSLIIYFYNLVLSTLGIDNPFLYDNPETMHEDIILDTDSGLETHYQHYKNINSRARHVTIVHHKGGKR